VDGGIKARSARGSIGESWWSRRFIDVLESFALGSRLTRGRAYARRGQVISLDVTSGAVVAVVQGSQPEPYRVRVGLKTFPERVWRKVEATLAAEAIHSARLLAGEMAPELEEVFAGLGVPLFPGELGELAMRCSCPDPAVPCKHLAATFYLLAEAFDADPFQLLRWRGRTREALLGHLRSLGPPGREVEPERGIGALAALADLADPPAELGRFWYPPVPLPHRPPTLVAPPGLVLRQLPNRKLAEALGRAYERFAEAEDLAAD
jgi:uncharacterized Zn finger protein